MCIAANQRSNLWLPSDDTELDTTPTTGYCPKVKAAEEAVAKLINERFVDGHNTFDITIVASHMASG